ncbi:hypothetical protein GPECTOR_122g466 [Gonium pectorale]|uniref:UDP-N-acetylglucosamine diphosphorylase n=1 Tax=Gonium pectorale TaxID=33097 RepID=A0A150FZS9_GONPE|nr:hypothetical protein GPECTOR_122g466 [Gonium pectorale]|eukprot:KXZ42725.1 hypothetical protein GPECTOR_122g466 [Gonium pectorale]
MDVRPPLLTEEGQAVLEPGQPRVARGAPGSGEVFTALRRSGALTHLLRSGARCVEVQALEDNLTARTLDPAFLGACAAERIDAAAKVAVPGVDAGGLSALPELYSRYLELLGSASPVTAALSGLLPATGTYYFTADALARIEAALRTRPLAMYRLAPADKVPAAGAKGAAGPGYRLERRLSDFVTPAVRGARGGGWVLDAGGEVASPEEPEEGEEGAEEEEEEEEEEATPVVEVSPLVSYGGESLAPLVKGRRFEEAYVRELQGFAPVASGGGEAGAAAPLAPSTTAGAWALPAVLLYCGVLATKLVKK